MTADGLIKQGDFCSVQHVAGVGILYRGQQQQAGQTVGRRQDDGFKRLDCNSIRSRISNGTGCTECAVTVTGKHAEAQHRVASDPVGPQVPVHVKNASCTELNVTADQVHVKKASCSEPKVTADIGRGGR